MKRLDCPFCGPRELEEFAFRKTQPHGVAADAIAQVYLRINEPGESHEYWQHLGGCRAWLSVRRNPSSGEVLDVRLLGQVVT